MYYTRSNKQKYSQHLKNDAKYTSFYGEGKQCYLQNENPRLANWVSIEEYDPKFKDYIASSYKITALKVETKD